MAIGLPVAALILFLTIVAVLWFFQRSLIYPIPPIDESLPAGFEPISYETSDGLTLRAGFQRAEDGKPTLLFFHGNGVDWQTTFFTTELLAARGYGVLAAEYRGYSGNSGSPSEKGLFTDGRAALDWLLARGIDPADIVLVGNSLGSGVAVELARTFPARALILIAPFKSMADTARYSYPYVPVDYLLQDRFDNIGKIAEVASPILIIHGENDGLIPIRHAQDLAAANPAARFVTLPGFGHNMSGEVAAQLPQMEFLDDLTRQ